MRKLDIHGLKNKKIRGIKRKCQAMVQAMVACTSSFPEEDHPGSGYWHTHLPVAEAFIDSRKTPFRVRRLCLQTLVDRASHLISLKPAGARHLRVVAVITLPCLWDSQLIIFFGDEYFSQFFNRNNEYQTWELQENNKRLLNQYHLIIPAGMTSRYYLETIAEQEYRFTNQLLFIGELT